MVSLRKIGRLFVIKTRLEAFLVTYAITVGAVERGMHYMSQMPGADGKILAAACLGVPFIAGAKLVDSVKPTRPAKTRPATPGPRRARKPIISRNRPSDRRLRSGSRSQLSHRKD